MAKGKGQITEEQLASGLASVGSMSGLTATTRPKRDNPFATVNDAPVNDALVSNDPVIAEPAKPQPTNSHIKNGHIKTVEVKLSQDETGEKEGHRKVEITSPYAADVAAINLRNSEPTKVKTSNTEKPAREIQPQKIESREIKIAGNSSRRVASRATTIQEKEVTPTKAELYPERVTTPMSDEMRAQVDSLSRELQRIRTEKGDRITSASVVRVAIQTFLDSFEPDGVGGEDELLEFARKQFGLKG